MMYSVVIKPRALKDLKMIHKQNALRIIEALDRLESDLTGDVKKLTNFTREAYR